MSILMQDLKVRCWGLLLSICLSDAQSIPLGMFSSQQIASKRSLNSGLGLCLKQHSALCSANDLLFALFKCTS